MTATSNIKKKIHIENVTYKIPCVYVQWSDGTETHSSDASLASYTDNMKYDNHNDIYIIDTEDGVSYIDYNQWKQEHLVIAICNKLLPNLDDIVDKWL